MRRERVEREEVPSWGTALAKTLEMPIAATAMARMIAKVFIVFVCWCFGYFKNLFVKWSC